MDKKPSADDRKDFEGFARAALGVRKPPPKLPGSQPDTPPTPAPASPTARVFRKKER